MMDPYLDLRCGGCGWTTTHDTAGIAVWLRRCGQLRRQSEATADELRELAVALAPRQACPRCGAVGLQASLVDDDADWPRAARCEACGKPIPRERLEVFPNATLCAECQASDERGELAGTGEYCAKCGAPLVIRPGRGKGVQRYVLVCSGNPPCRR